MGKFLTMEEKGFYSFNGGDESAIKSEEVCPIMDGYECFMSDSEGRYASVASMLYFVQLQLENRF